MKPADALDPPILLEPPTLLDPPAPPTPPAPPEPPPVDEPVPRKVVTLEGSSETESAPFVAGTMPSLAKLLLDEVVYFAYDEICDPSTVMASDFADEFVLTITMTTSVSF